MKKVIPTLIALALFIGMFFYYKHFKDLRLDKELNNGFIWKWEQNKITQINITSENEFIKLKRDGDTWDILSPIEYPANSFNVSNIIARFSSPTFNEIVEENPKNLITYGLKSPTKSITLTNDEGLSNTLNLGSLAPLSRGYYAYNNNKVYTMDFSIWDEIPLELTYLRKKSLLSFNSDYIDKITVENEGNFFSIISKEEDGKTNWYIDNRLLNQASVNSLITSLNGKIIKEFVDDNASKESLKKYGLENPRAKITLYLNDRDESRLMLYIGELKEDMAYATTDMKFIYKIESSFLLPQELTVDYFMSLQ